MHRYLTKNYALLGKEIKTNDKITSAFRKIIKTPSIQFILFGILMCIVGVLATEKILPYSWQSAFASRLSKWRKI